ncbi:ribosome silencing factor [bacterium 1XD8-76]|nr:ribosome silencing factor [bacterium 1XD8-76]
MEAKEMAKLAIESLEDKKAEDIKVIDISDISTIADYFIIASGKNRSQIQAMCDNVEETMGRAGVSMKQTEGYKNANWVLMDYGDIIVHIFDMENRLFYDLERIWRDGKEIEADKL